MSAEPLFSNGCFRVREGAETLGFVWVEPAPGPLPGQLQRWVLIKPLGNGAGRAALFDFEPWGAITSLPQWSAAVTAEPQLDVEGQNAQQNAEWGANPASDGLWPVGGAAYIVAQSTMVMPELVGNAVVFGSAAAVYPRRDAVANNAALRRAVRAPRHVGARRRASGAAGAGVAGMQGPTDLESPRLGSPPPPWGPEDPGSGQIVIPLIEIRQKTAQGRYVTRGIGGAQVDPKGGTTYFEGTEMFLLQPEYKKIGTQGLQVRWDSDTSVKQVVDNLGDLQALIQVQWTQGCRYEVTGCNYYLGDEPPPADFL